MCPRSSAERYPGLWHLQQVSAHDAWRSVASASEVRSAGGWARLRRGGRGGGMHACASMVAATGATAGAGPPPLLPCRVWRAELHALLLLRLCRSKCV